MTEKKGKPRSSRWLSRNTLGMSLTSFYSDASYEMATSVLQGFIATIDAPPFALGIIEGGSDAAASFIKLFAGWLSDDLEKDFQSE